MSETVIDEAVLRELEETTGAEFAAELIETFLQEAPAMLDELKSAAEASDADAYRRAAHSIKSNANTFGAVTLAEAALEMEMNGLAAATQTGATGLDALFSEYERAAAALQERLNG
jgi:HPt (histidine-containing phosphotransfer) domain-containing protein